MKIGIGATTYNRPKNLELWNEQVLQYRNDNTEVYIADDSKDRKGIAYLKSECLRALKDCDYIFLFDDDCFPIKSGWADFFINASRLTGQQHFMYLKETPTIKKIDSFSREGYTADIYDNCAGCMMFLTKEVIEKVGAYNPKYGIYGFEHAGYSKRIHKAGLTPLGEYSCPAGAGEYIYSMDLDNHLPFNKQVGHKPSIEIKRVSEYINQNKAIYLQDTEVYISL